MNIEKLYKIIEDRIKTKKEQQVLNSILGYASSQSELSAPYIKLSDE